MKKNVGKTDRILRVVLGVAVVVLASVLKVWWLTILGAAVIFTGIVGWCGLYSLFGINTCKIKK